jgi:hypothetical protein
MHFEFRHGDDDTLLDISSRGSGVAQCSCSRRTFDRSEPMVIWVVCGGDDVVDEAVDASVFV